MNALMLGWELPPRISGGLGRACAGLLRGLADQPGLHTTFVLPGWAGLGIGGSGSVTILPVGGTRAPAAGHWTNDDALKGRTGSYGRSLEHETRGFADSLVRALPSLPPFDLIHAHDWLTFEAGMRLKHLTGKKLVTHVHSTECDRRGGLQGCPTIQAIEQRGMDSADGIIAVSNYTKAVIAREYGQHPERIKVIHNATASSATAEGRPTRGYPGGRAAGGDRLVTFLGRVTHQKGPELFLECAHLIWRQMPAVRFVMAGDGDLIPLLKSLTRAFGMEGVVSFPGFLDDQGVDDLLSSSDLLIMPSVSEPFGLVALEAIWANVPVVLSNRCGVTEVIKSAVSVDPYDIDTLAEWSVRLLRDDALSRHLADATRTEAGRLSWEGAASTLRQVYVDLLGQARPVPATGRAG